MRIGYGFDLHAFGDKKPLIIGGVSIPYEIGLIAHSNGDVLIHAIIDSLLGATAMGDIGTFFPSNNQRYKNIDSRILLKNIWKKITLKNYDICNLDATIIAECPKMSSYIFSMRSNLSLDLQTKIENISIKATSAKMIGCIGRKEGISCQAVVMLVKNIRR
ncbi:2-C-methyl-D-erythritol 2,4-cyclodiphosphate synthase [Buchnera aphidicola]|uniref:2-C-methyl-D-erythritol 2,4-cyclodiphosphate synthase n=1 Tax=Buchnera aphidicola str. USDA (Myzus persicae) TaxID=1009856 RepID=W0NZP8_BUCMP|nr:2-C-methyl-D-erythritol 2,4-cyclodiphosphate synthase [Buchnera aphidicola]AHG59976.1 Ispf [Buchnera aphidicola str. USDA (Myzus persicae)]AHG60556.1 Ispf [Buchnera aphidicola str. W106 (Myzus persicae)]AHG61129.1 Ispf [Buchnera aphidicola str. G002 (Myzus persicae)]AHG61701.1 Ispf [Buchnera aphidicola str. F009 (Myzus persicae)]WAI03342.1 MAG: 2-C-methyl-D-erythritol 2,4-cyclodiphosphate synthase [Buchnera aphidicola (Myzus persicae)]